MIRKAVFPVAGLGTRFLPATKANPKEMLPIVDTPLIQYAVEEAIAAGCTELIFVTSHSKRAIEDHFDKNYELEQRLVSQNKTKLVNLVRDVLPQGVTCSYLRQPEALGLGHAVLCAKSLVGQESFAVLLADDLISSNDTACLTQMVQHYEQGSSLIAVETINDMDCEKYGIIQCEQDKKNPIHVTGIVEKPLPQNAPSRLGVVGRYLFTPEIFEHLEKIPHIEGREIQLTDAIASLLKTQSVKAYTFDGERFDCGSKLGYLKAIVNFGCRHQDIGDEFSEFLQVFVEELKTHSRKAG